MADEKKKSGFDPLILLILAGAAIIAFLELKPPVYSSDAIINTLLKNTVTRAAGILVFIPLAIRCRYRLFGFGMKLKALLVSIPAFLVVINNLPIIGLATGNAYLTHTGRYIWLYALESFAIGLFEELAFRGVLFPAILEKQRSSTRRIFWATVISSALFGGVHLFNLFAGGSPGSVLLQVGYSFLIGGMCSVVLLKTKNIWICVALHTIFDFNGFLVPTLGDGIIWDAATVAVTAVLGVATLVHFLFVMKNVKPEDIQDIFPE